MPKYVIKIGQRYYKADDVEPVSTPSKALRFDNAETAEREAVMVRETWSLKPKGGATTSVKVVTL